jgi:hypothetical protein
MRFKLIFTAVLSVSSVLPSVVLACSTCGCTLSSDWESHGLSSTPGFHVDFRYDYIDQTQMRHGDHTANGAQIAAAQAAGALEETETETTNHYYTLGFDYSPSRQWGINVQVPYIDRDHGTLAFDNTNPGALDTAVSSSHTKALGDVKVLGRYQGFSPDGDLGMMFGVKFATGKHDENFSSGPLAGSPLDRSLQAGTGSTDVILGIYRFGTLSRSWDWFAQGLYQYAADTKNDFRPGDSVNANVGVRYMEFGNLIPQLQINAKTAPHDTGSNADTVNSGGQIVYVSPGVTVALSKATKLYGFLQLPLYQHVEGFQLAPKWNATIGVNIGF